MNHEQARDFSPKARTYAIRIFDTDPKCKELYGKLLNFRSEDIIKEYFFDDITYTPEHEEGDGDDYCSITDSIAAQISSDFSAHRDSIDELLVHCRQGQSRSPAVAMALNDIFNLGNNRSQLVRDFPKTNSFVYSFMIRNRGFN